MKMIKLICLFLPLGINSQDTIESSNFFNYTMFNEEFTERISIGSFCTKYDGESNDSFVQRSIEANTEHGLKIYEFNEFKIENRKCIITFHYIDFNQIHPTRSSVIEYKVLIGLIYVPTKNSSEYMIAKIGEWIPGCGWRRNIKDVFIVNNQLMIITNDNCHRQGQFYSTFVYSKEIDNMKLQLKKQLNERCDYSVILDSLGNELDIHIGEENVKIKSFPCNQNTREKIISLMK